MVVPLCTNQLVFPSTSEGGTVGKAMRNVRAHVQDPGQWHGVGDQPFKKKGWDTWYIKNP
jgi:hypothetical protein